MSGVGFASSDAGIRLARRLDPYRMAGLLALALAVASALPDPQARRAIVATALLACPAGALVSAGLSAARFRRLELDAVLAAGLALVCGALAYLAW